MPLLCWGIGAERAFSNVASGSDFKECKVRKVVLASLWWPGSVFSLGSDVNDPPRPEVLLQDRSASENCAPIYQDSHHH